MLVDKKRFSGRFTKFLLICILMVYAVFGMPEMSCASTADLIAADMEYIRVGLDYGSSANYAHISAGGGLRLGRLENSIIMPVDSPVNGYGDAVLVSAGDGIEIMDTSGNVLDFIADDGSTCLISSDYYTESAPVFYDGKEYRGGITAVKNSAGGINVINIVNIEDYVKGVLNKEIGHTGSLEALKAQAVTARSYAAANASRHSKDGFNVCTSTHCQSYDGVSGEYDSTNDAVDETPGLLMYYDGKPVAGYYFANSGGATENSEDVWGSEIGYLRGIIDEFSPDSNWTVSFTKAQLDETFSGSGIGSVQSVTLDEVNPSGYVASVTVTGTNSSVTVKRDSIRSMFSSSLRSRNFTIDTAGGTLVPGAGAGADEGRYYVLNGKGRSVLDSLFSVITVNGLESLKLGGVSILNGKGNIVTAVPEASNADAPGTAVYLNSDSDQLIISGKGFGHGIGMSQDGALVMGAAGYSFIDILDYYYTDIEVR